MIRSHASLDGGYRGERRGALRTRRDVVVFFLGCTAVVGWLYIGFGTNIFRVRSIETGQLVILERGEVVKKTYEILDRTLRRPWNHRNLLLLNTKRLERDLQSELYVARVTVDKSWPNGLKLTIKERQSTLIIIANEQFYVVDKTGAPTKTIINEDQARILERIQKPSPTESLDAPILSIRQMDALRPGARLTDAETVQRWMQALHELQEAGFGYRNAVLDYVTSSKLILTMYEPYDVYMDVRVPFVPQIQTYYAFVKTKTPRTTVTQYVDVRIPGRVYYK
jgi:hypothetical protein